MGKKVCPTEVSELEQCSLKVASPPAPKASAPGMGPEVVGRSHMVRVVQAALGGSEHALWLHHKHVVEVPNQHGQQRQESQAEAEASEGTAHSEGQPVYQPVGA